MSIKARQRSPFKRTPSALRIVRAEEDAAAEVFLYDEISLWGITANAFVREIKALDVETIHVRINSPGGNVFDAVAIANALRQHKARIVAHIDGLAASAATIVALAAEEVRMAPDGFFMIHDPWLISIGNAEQLRKDAEMLDKVNDASIVKTYIEKTGATEKQVRDWMRAETWFNAEEAEDAGFVDVIEDLAAAAEPAPENAFDLSVFSHPPAELVSRAGTGTTKAPSTIRDFEAFLRDEGGFSHAAAKAIASGGFKGASDPRDEDGGDLHTMLATVQRVTSTLSRTTP